MTGLSESVRWIWTQSRDTIEPMRSPESLQKGIDDIKRRISALGDLHPGALTEQYNVCGSPGCQCKSTPPIKHGPYHQLSFTRHGKSTSRFVREQDVADVERQLDNYRRLRQLVNDWIDLSVEIAHSRRAAAGAKTKPKSRTSRGKSPKI